MVQWLTLGIFHCRALGSTPGQGTKILQDARYDQKKKEHTLNIIL